MMGAYSELRATRIMNTFDIKELETEGRVYVPYPPELRIGVEEAVGAWKEFCALPEEMKVRFSYDPDAKTSGNGYELKKGSSFDLKENVHLRVNAQEMLLERARAVDDVVAPRFVEKALALNGLMGPLLRAFAEGVEREYGIPGFADDVMAKQPDWLIRFLHYFGDREPGEEIATPHTDKGGFTLHLYESAPGVERLTYDKKWVEMPLPGGKTVIIPGMGLQNRSRCRLKATCHRVVATEETAQTGRFSAVCFLNFRNARYFDKSRFGAQQEWAPGAFYDMPFEEFDTFFID